MMGLKSWWTVGVVCFWCFTRATSQSEETYRIGFLWDGKVIPQATHLQQSLNAMVNVSADFNITVSYIDVTDKTPFQIYSLICGEILQGTVGFISACGCYTGVTVNSVIKDLQVPLVALETGCEYGDGTMSNIVYFPHTRLDIGRAVAQVISHVGWMNTVLIYDEQTAMKMDRVMEKLSESNATVQAFRINDFRSTGEVQAILDFVRDNYLHPTNFLLVCSLECIQEVLLQANLYDRMNDVQALYTFQTQWLLLTEGSWLRDLQSSSVGDIDNVASVVPMRATDKSSESLVEEAFSYLLQSTRMGINTYKAAIANSTTTTAYPGNMKNCNESKELFGFLTTELRMILSDSFTLETSGYQVYTAMRKGFGGEKRVFQVVSQWTPSKPVSGRVFPNLLFGLNARNFLVTTNSWPPFVTRNESALNATDGYYGLCMEMLMELSSTLNFTYNIIEPEDGEWGSFRNNTWTGLTGQMHRKEADLVVAPLAATVDRKTAMDFTEPFYQDYTTVLVQLPDPDASKWNLYISPFKWDVWLCIALSIPCMGMIIWLFTKYSPHYSPSEIGRGLAQLDNAMLYALGSIFSQGGIHLPTAQSGRFVVGFWWMYCIVVVATYSGNLIAFLTVSIPTLPFNTLEEMVNSNYKFGTVGGTAFINAIQSAKQGSLKDVNDKMEEFWKKDKRINSTDADIHIKRVFSENYGWIGDKTAIEREMAKFCDVDMIREEFIPMQYALGLQRNSAYNFFISAGVKKIIEGGLINKWKQKHWPRQNFCSRGLVTESKPVSLKDVQGAYYALGILILAAACILMIEQVLKRTRLASWWEEYKGTLFKGYSSYIGTPGYANGYANKGMASGYVANGHIANGHVANGHVANGHVANGHIANGHVEGHTVANGVGPAPPAYGATYATYDYSNTTSTSNGDLHAYMSGDVSKRSKKKNGTNGDPNDITSGAPVFSRSLFR